MCFSWACCRDWVDYRDGFGDFKKWNDEFWLGNEHIHVVVSGGTFNTNLYYIWRSIRWMSDTLLFDLIDLEDPWVEAYYYMPITTFLNKGMYFNLNPESESSIWILTWIWFWNTITTTPDSQSLRSFKRGDIMPPGVSVISHYKLFENLTCDVTVLVT